MKKILMILALALTMGTVAIAANSGKVGFFKATDPSLQEQAAEALFKTICGTDAPIITDAAKINVEDYDCIWIHIDRTNMNQGWNNLPETFTTEATSNALKNYLEQGGNLYLSGHATQLLVPYGRISEAYAPNVYGKGDGNNQTGKDVWSVNANFNGTDHSSHPAYKNLETGIYNDWDHLTYGFLYSGGNDYHRDDHNCMWAFEAMGGIDNFQNSTKSIVLGTWGQVKNGENGGLIEFYPIKNGEGTIIANGFAAYQLYMYNNEVNTFAGNIESFTSNILSYLAPEDGKKPNFFEFDEESLYSSKKVALFVGYPDETGLFDADNREGKAIYNFFKARYPENIIFRTTEDEIKSKISKKYYDCIWVHIDRPGILSAEDMPFTANGPVITALKQFVEDGGNIYLSKQATMLIDDIDAKLPEPNRVNLGEAQTTVEENEPWFANIMHNGKDYTMHPIFHDMNQVTRWGMAMVELASGKDVKFNDNTAMWQVYGERETPLKNTLEEFENDYNARVLATWGHNDNDAMWFGGIIEFKSSLYSRQNAPRRVNSGIPMDERRGIIMANGMGGYEWTPKEGSNESLDEIQKMTANILAYLSPAAEEEVEEVTVTVSATNQENGIYSEPFSTTGTVTIEKGITLEVTGGSVADDFAKDFVVTLKPVNVSEWKTYIGQDPETEYQTVLNNPVSVFQQWQSIGGAKAVVDGFYNGDGEIPGQLANMTTDDNGKYTFDIELPVPCSGKYTLSITQNTGSGLTITNPEDMSNLTVEIYPNLFGQFGEAGIEYSVTDSNGTITMTSGTDMGFNVNGYTFAPDDEDTDIKTINIPSDMENLAKAIGYIPGTYFASSLVAVSNDVQSDENATPGITGSSSDKVRRHADESDEDVIPSLYFTPVDLSYLNTNNSVELEVTVEKNSVSHTFKFQVVKVDDGEYNVSTGIDELEGETQATPIYYNLQGVRIAHPDKGIFIKIEGNKISKVIL